MQRTPRPYSSYESHGSPPSRLPHRCTGIGPAVGVRGGRRPSGGSITSEVRRDVVLYSRQCGIGAPAPCTGPDRTSTRARSCSSRTRMSCMRFAYSSSVRNCRVPYCAGRSNGTPYSPSVVHSPCRSGSPHGVRARHAVSAPGLRVDRVSQSTSGAPTPPSRTRRRRSFESSSLSSANSMARRTAGGGVPEFCLEFARGSNARPDHRRLNCRRPRAGLVATILTIQVDAVALTSRACVEYRSPRLAQLSPCNFRSRYLHLRCRRRCTGPALGGAIAGRAQRPPCDVPATRA